MTVQTLLTKLVPTLHEDNILLAVNKPTGVDVGRIPNRPIIFNLVDTLAEASTGSGEGLFVTNRLARHESGVLLLAKDRATADHIRIGLKTGHVTQVYTVLLKGKMKGKRLLIQTSPSPATPDRGRRDRGKTKSARADGVTEVVRLETGETRTLISCTTVAENTHVLRAQLRSVGLHLVGDSRSTAGDTSKPPTAPHLHLSKVSFHHPGRKSRLTVHCPLPGGFAASVLGQQPSETSRGKKPTARSGDKITPSTLVEQRLLTALLTRFECLLDEQTDSRRLLTGESVPSSPGDIRGKVSRYVGGYYAKSVLCREFHHWVVIIEVVAPRSAAIQQLIECGISRQVTVQKVLKVHLEHLQGKAALVRRKGLPEEQLPFVCKRIIVLLSHEDHLHRFQFGQHCLCGNGVGFVHDDARRRCRQ